MRQRAAEFALALAFFTRFPVRVDAQLAFRQCLWAAPLAGLCASLPGALLLWTLPALIGAAAAAVMAAATLVILTGALHEDGFADCADGFWGGSDTERRLSIMRDSRIGVYGVLALLGVVGLKASLIAHLAAGAPGFAALAFIGSATLARAAGLFPAVSLPHARDDGLAVALGRPGPPEFRAALLVALVTVGAVFMFVAPVAFAFAFAGAIATAIAVAKLAEAKIGGHTGDVFGAAIVAADLASLLVMTMWTHLTGAPQGLP